MDNQSKIVITFPPSSNGIRTGTATHPCPIPLRRSPRMRRLYSDADSMIRAFMRFSPIQIVRADGTPPDRYQIQYNIMGLVRGAGGQPVRRDSHLVEIQLTAEYPRQSPKCKILTPIFHPNFDPTIICVGDHWTAAESLVDLVVRIGEMIAYQQYNVKSPLDGEAAMWADLNKHLFPIDPTSLRPPEGPTTRVHGL